MGEHLLITDDAFWTAQRLRYNRTATTDPDNNDDATQDADGGYQAGSLWFNTTTGTIWMCRVATISGAVWKRLGGRPRRVVMRVGITNPPEPVSNVGGDGFVYMEVE